MAAYVALKSQFIDICQDHKCKPIPQTLAFGFIDINCFAGLCTQCPLLQKKRTIKRKEKIGKTCNTDCLFSMFVYSKIFSNTSDTGCCSMSSVSEKSLQATSFQPTAAFCVGTF